ncbi:inositol-trisphosphate 3-kinase B isoform X1 [Sitophilus oryzae]|uniref:Kinase n=2 Tax=Sitophilus oryzae TaxID=7048 RepID=A0A6J2YCP9_SITOR|nr:inositol-trisphosphate 3-kinase B isoform X1 [Sitophilus oryzae]XP_030760960.1 inositol-trisphosphate 3-kinase B isoform X1 [Sitophilus oryzae]
MKWHCFAGFWSPKTTPEDDDSAPWIYTGVRQVRIVPPKKAPCRPFVIELTPSDIFQQDDRFIDEVMARRYHQGPEDLRELVRAKAEKHKTYFRSLIDSPESRPISTINRQMADRIPQVTVVNSESSTPEGRQRRQGVYELQEHQKEENNMTFKSVKELRTAYIAMLEKTSEEKLLAPPQSDYCSSSASGASDDEKDRVAWRKSSKVQRCGSADSAMGQSDEDHFPEILKKKVIASHSCPQLSPYSPRGSIDHSNVPSRTILEAQCVLFPVDHRKSSVDCVSEETTDYEADSRRQSCFTDDGEESTRYRYWRTPSVVVSDYSDDIMGCLTLEDIEYMREHRKGADASSSPESSPHSSCSNLNYCGSTISGLESEYVLAKPYRKSSNCSTCSTLSGDEEQEGGGEVVSAAGDAVKLRPNKRESSGWRKLRNIVQWTPFFQTYKKQRYPWVQLAGHQGNFKAGPDQGTILKKLCVKEEKCFQVLMKDVLRPYVPEYKGLVASDDGESEYIQLQDLLGDFKSPCVMDCKIGVRTYLEEELAKAKEKPKLRKDMYEKMCQIDQKAPTEEEHKLKGVTKPRYMVWRETISSTATLGFRIEGIRNADGTSSKDFKTTKTREQIMDAFIKFTEGFPHAVPKYIQRLKAIKATLEQSKFFETHEVIGSSLLFVHDSYSANVWLIDFAKTLKLPDGVNITHNSKWKVGNHEDGYLIGISNLIKIFKDVLENQPISITPPLSLQDPPAITSEVERELRRAQEEDAILENT